MSYLGPLVFPLFALTHLVIALLALGLLDTVPVAASCLFIVELITFYDNLVVALGNRLGVGSRAERLNRARFFFHGTLISLLIPVYWQIASTLGIAAFQTNLSQLLVVGIVIVVSALGYVTGYLKIGPIIPINYFGCLRYAQSVSDQTRRTDYHYSERELNAKAMPPLASIATVVIGMGISLWVGWLASFWVAFVVTLMMFTAASFPIKTWGPLATSVVEVIFSGGLLYSLSFAAQQSP